MSKILTVSIASYNAECYLEKCLDSFTRTEVLDDLEIFVVNDGSEDNTGAIGKKYERLYPYSVKIINKENGGHGSTINESIKNATAKYFKIVDADDWVEKEGIEKLVRFLKLNTVDLILNPYLEINASDENETQIVFPGTNSVEMGMQFELEKIDDLMLYMHSITYRTELLKMMGPIIDEHCFYVDMEYSLFPLQYVKTGICLEFPVYNYLLGTATQSMNMNNLIKRRDQHLKITKRLIIYYEDNKNVLEGFKKRLFCERLKYAALNQYKIYFYMNSNEGREELRQFDKWLKKCSKDVYRGPEGRFMKIIKFNRFLNFFLYGLSTSIFKKLKILPYA